MNRLPPASPARRHFMGIVAAGAGRLSTIAISSALLAALPVKNADALGLFPRDDPHRHRGPDHNCFGRGTLILTAHGEVPVEDLANGALVMTTNGALPVKWVGRRTIRRNASASWHPSVVPIRVSRFAIDDQTPQRDLYLSQEHCLLIDGVLIPVKHLVNGRSIAFDDDAKMSETIEYFCVELDTHEVIFAEGTAVETFQYRGGQIAWDNLGDYQDLYGEHKVMSAFAPICRYSGVRAEVGGLLRLAASRFVDVRDPIQIAYDRIAARAMAIAA
jgi:Hint domain-containing protein